MSAPSAAKRKPANKRASARKTAAPTKPKTPPRTEPMVVKTYGDEQITSPLEWQSATMQGQVIELPSGNFARVKRTLNLQLLLETGKVPNPLADIIRDMIDNKSSTMPIKEDDIETITKMMAFIETLMVDIFVNPKVAQQPKSWDASEDGVWVPSDGVMDAAKIDIEDQMYVFAFAQGASLDVATFRERSVEAMASLQHVNGLEDTAVGPAKD